MKICHQCASCYCTMIILEIIVLCVGFISISIAMLQKRNSEKHSVHARDFLAKFHQHDYKLEFERVERVHFDKQYTKMFDIITFKYNRTFTAVNMSWISLVDIGFDYNMVIQAYRFASNEYRLFPMRFQLNLCDSIKENVFGFKSLARCGNFTGCPFLKNKIYNICNWSPDQAHFPPLVPSGKYMLEIQGLFRTAEMYIIRGYGTIDRPIAKK